MNADQAFELNSSGMIWELVQRSLDMASAIFLEIEDGQLKMMRKARHF